MYVICIDLDKEESAAMAVAYLIIHQCITNNER